MAEPHSSAQTSRPRRTLLPSPGVMFVLTLLIAGGVAAALIGIRYNEQQRLIAHVEAHGGAVTTSLEPEWLYQFAVNSLGEERARGFGDIVAVDFNNDWSTLLWGGGPSWVSFSTAGGTMPASPVVATTEFNNDTLAELGQLTSLKSLSLQNRTFDDDGLRHVSRLTGLEHLSLRGTQVGNDGLRHLRTLVRLESLDLGSTSVNGAGLAHLSRHAHLKTLVLEYQPISDADVPLLAGMTSLEQLTLTNTFVSSEGVEELRRQLPGCQIDY